MSEHIASISWKRTIGDFSYDSYSRDHQWQFDSDTEVLASASPDYQGNPDRVDPEEALVAALSSCHMLTFLAIASRKRLTVDEYTDKAVGFLEKNAEGKFAITRAELNPMIRFSASVKITQEEFDRLHLQAHEACFIANSIKTKVIIKGRRL